METDGFEELGEGLTEYETHLMKRFQFSIKSNRDRKLNTEKQYAEEFAKECYLIDYQLETKVPNLAEILYYNDLKIHYTFETKSSVIGDLQRYYKNLTNLLEQK